MKRKDTMRVCFLAGFMFLSGCTIPARPLPPMGLMCELMPRPEEGVITDAKPEFTWIVRSVYSPDMQSGYQIVVGTTKEKVRMGQGDLWDSGHVESGQSVAVSYAGQSLQSHATYYWSVRVWTEKGYASPWSEVQRFHTGDFSMERKWPGESRWVTFKDEGKERWGFENRQTLVFQDIKPVKVLKKGEGHYYVDFGRASFGTLRLKASLPEGALYYVPPVLKIRLGEKCLGDNSVDMDPPSPFIVHEEHSLALKPGTHTYILKLPRHKSTMKQRAICLPDNLPEVTPFRCSEIIGNVEDLQISDFVQEALYYSRDNEEAKFSSSDPVLNQVWDLCRHTLKGCSFLGVYVDGNRERLPYEADTIIQQISHYMLDQEYAMARYSHEYLIFHPTWPTEYSMISVVIAWRDYLYSGDLESLARYYEDLKAKTLIDLARPDGLIQAQGEDGSHVETESFERKQSIYGTEELRQRLHMTQPFRDLVDWPPTSQYRDDYVFKQINTVVNAHHQKALRAMSRIAEALGKRNDAEMLAKRADEHKKVFNEKLFDLGRGVYVDGEGTDHASLHANLFALSCGLVPEEYKDSVIQFIRSRGMRCSVFAAQYLLEGLYQSNEDEYALELLTAMNDTSWYNMIREGATMTAEAWSTAHTKDMAVSDIDWNHAWACAPTNIIPRYLMGVRPLEPGFGKILIQPQPGHLREASLDLPTVRGSVHVEFQNDPGKHFDLKVTIPTNMTARIDLPKMDIQDTIIFVNGIPQTGIQEGRFIVLDTIGSGSYRFERNVPLPTASRGAYGIDAQTLCSPGDV